MYLSPDFDRNPFYHPHFINLSYKDNPATKNHKIILGMKPLKLLAILSLTIALAIPFSFCGNDDNDTPTPPPPTNDDIELEEIPCINQPVIVNGKTMYNVFPDLDKFNSWWNSDKSQYFKDLYTKTYYLQNASSDFRVNRGEEMSGMFIDLRKDASKLVLGYIPVGTMSLSFYDL